MLIIALDYDYAPAAELTCTKDARTMYRPHDRYATNTKPQNLGLAEVIP